MSKLHIGAILALTAILGLVLWQSPPTMLKDFNSSAAKARPTYPETFMIQSRTIQYDEAGKISHILFSTSANNFVASSDTPTTLPGYALLTRPRIHFYDEDANHVDQKASWKASSDNAKSMDNNQEILMSGNVLLKQQTADSAETPTTIESETLLIRPDVQYAETDKPVTIKDSSGVTTSTGLTLSLDNDVIELLSNVRSRYEPR
jgi:LPS export ABC transporter protein LptC